MFQIMMMQRQELRLEQRHALLLTQEMRQSMQILQLPLIELKQWLEEQLQLSSSLEQIEGKNHLALVDEIPFLPSPFELLMQQARLEMEADELQTAEWIIGNLDERGFFPFSPTAQELQILQKIQQLGPPGIAARNLQECLLLQLENKKGALAYRLIQGHLDDLIHNRLQKIIKKVGCSMKTLKQVVKREILTLHFWPTAQFSIQRRAPLLVPDLMIDQCEDEWTIVVNEQGLPPLDEAFRLHNLVERRRVTLQKIAQCLIQKMASFFQGLVTYPTPLTMKEVAIEIGLHESTVARAIAGKAIQCIHGVLPIRSLFTSSLPNREGVAVSNAEGKQLLQALIQAENKSRPLRDEALALAMADSGIPCSRRTVSKYRQLLKIPSAAQRRKWT